MSHEVETMAYSGEVPWHGLGKKVSNDLTPAQMCKEAGLDWSVEKIELSGTFKGKKIPSERSALVRESDGKILTYTTKDWNPLQNADAFEFFSEFVHSGKMKMHTAGSLRDGKMVWALAEINESFTVFGKDRIKSYLLFSSPHEYGKPVDIRFTPIRVVCNNTITLALNTVSDLMVRVTHRHKFNPEQVKETMGLASHRLAEYKSMAQVLGKRKYTPENVVEYFKTVFPKVAKLDGVDAELADLEISNDNKEIVEKVAKAAAKKAGKAKVDKTADMSINASKAFAVLETQPGAEFGKGTWWQPFNAVTYIIDHHIGRDSKETRMNNAWYGPMRAKKMLALKKAMEYAEAA